MENKMNLVEILKDCPKGMELNCTMFDDVVFERVDSELPTWQIILRRLKSNTTFITNKYGQYYNAEDGKCVIFPKGKTTWEGFRRPFKDGDIVITTLGSIAIIKECIRTSYYAHCIWLSDQLLTGNDIKIGAARFATEEEKQELFDVIKSNGYRWNAETKTLEKLKFKEGDKVIRTATHETYVIDHITSTGYVYKNEGGTGFIFENEHLYELAPNKFNINTLVPFESKVLVRDNKTDAWKPAYWGFYDETNIMTFPYETVGGNCFSMCIPYEGNEHLIGKTDDCNDFYKNWK